MFPTMLRSTAQGVCFAIVRISLGVFSFFVPMLNATGFTNLAWILTGFLVISGIIGALWAPRNEGKSLEQLEAEQADPGHRSQKEAQVACTPRNANA